MWRIILIVGGMIGVAVPVMAQEWDPFAGSGEQSAGQEDVADDGNESRTVDADYSGLLYTRWNSDLKKNSAAEQLHELRNKALLNIDLRGQRKTNKWHLTLSGYAQYDIFPASDGLDASFEPELWEAYAVWKAPEWELSVGQQIRRWGRGIPSLVDIVTPADYSEFIFVEDEFQKRPVPMARWTKFGEAYELELIAIPFFRSARLPDSNSDWSAISIQDLDGIEDIPLAEGAIDQGISPGIVTTPEDDLLSSEFGLRWTKYQSGWDLDVFVFYGYEDPISPVFTPAFISFLQSEQGRGNSPIETLRSLAFQEIAAFSPIFHQQPDRQLTVAAAAVVPLEKVTARFELVGLSSQSIYTERLERIRVPSVQGLVGIDALAGDRFLWTLTFAGNVFVTDENLFLVNRYNLSTIGVMRIKPFDIGLWLETRALWNINLGDAFIGPSLLYDISSGFQAQAGVNVLTGADSTPLGQLDDNDYLWLRLKYIF